MFKLKNIGLLILSLLILCLFLSKTVYLYNLPVASAVSPVRGSLNKMELTTGTVSYGEVKRLYAGMSGFVAEILVQNGEAVSKGQAIMKMNFEKAAADINRQIEDCREETEAALGALMLAFERIKSDTEKIQRDIRNTELKIEEAELENVSGSSTSEYELEQSKKSLASAEENLKEAEILFAVGALSRQQFDEAESGVSDLKSKYEQQKRAEEEKRSDDADTQRKSLRDYNYQLENYKQDLKNKELDLSENLAKEPSLKRELEKKLEDFEKTLADYEMNSVIYAPEDSFINSIDVNEGQYAEARTELCSFAPSENLIIDCEVNLNNNFIMPGDTCKLDNTSCSLSGTVERITPDEQSKKIRISIPADKSAAGESFNIRFEKKGSETFILIANAALNMDGDGYYLNQIKRRDGILGKEFYTKKVRVYPGDSDSENTVIIKGMDFLEPVVLSADKPFSEDETVKLRNEGDFFE